MKANVSMLRSAVLALSLVSCFSFRLRADVWSDCEACYRGGFDDNNDGCWYEGAWYRVGEFKDVMHASDPSNWRHKCLNQNCANQFLYYHTEVVTSACANAAFPARKVLWLDTTRGRPDEGTDTPDPSRYIYGAVNLPAADDGSRGLITNRQWTALLRYKVHEVPLDPSDTLPFMYLADFGLGNDEGFMLQIPKSPATNQLGIACNWYSSSGIGTGLYLTNSIVTKKEGVWTELAVVVDDGTIRFGVFLPGSAPQWKSYTIPGGKTAFPHNIWEMRLGGWYDRAKTGFNGAYDMAAFWNRQLTDGEVVEAFSAGHPAILKVGAEGCGKRLFTGTAASANVNALAADVRGVPATFSAGTQLTVDYAVPSLQTNLAQAVRIVVSEAAATFDVAIDDVSVGSVEATPTTAGLLFVPAEKFTEGDHALTLACTAGNGAVLECVELTGSWRLGPEDGQWTGFGSYGAGTGWCETTADKAGQRDFYLGLRDNIINVRFGEANPGAWFETTHVWPDNRYQNLHFTLTPEMAERGRYEFAYRLTDGSTDNPSADFPPEIEVLVNGVSRQVQRLFAGAAEGGRLHTLTIPREWLRVGDNVITTRYAHNLESTGTVGHEIRYDYYKLSLKKLSSTNGLAIIVR